MIPDQKMMYVSQLYPKWDNHGEFWFTANAIGKIAVNAGFDKIFSEYQDKGGARGRADDQPIPDWINNKSSAINSRFEPARTETTSKGRTAA